MKKTAAIAVIMSMTMALTACTNLNPSTYSKDKDSDSNAHAYIASTTTDTSVVAANPEGTDAPENDQGAEVTPVTDHSWKEIYVDYLENHMDEIFGEDNDEWKYSWTWGFIYVNDDKIPELVLSSGYEAGGNVILTIVNGQVDFIYTRRLGFYYDESGNVLVNSDGHMGVYFDYVYTIGDNGFEFLASGDYYDIYDDENGYTGEMEYYLGEQKVSETEYYDVIESYIPVEERLYWADGSTYDSVINYLKGNVYEGYREAYKEVADEWLGTDNVYLALIESDKAPSYLVLDNNNWMYIYYFQDGMAFRGEDFYLSESSNIFFYPETGVAESFYESSYDMGLTYYIYSSNMGSSHFSYAGRSGKLDEEGNLLKDENGYIFEYTVNGAKVSEMEYAEYLDQYQGDCVEIKVPGAEDSEVEFLTPEEMSDYLSR